MGGDLEWNEGRGEGFAGVAVLLGLPGHHSFARAKERSKKARRL